MITFTVRIKLSMMLLRLRASLCLQTLKHLHDCCFVSGIDYDVSLLSLPSSCRMLLSHGRSQFSRKSHLLAQLSRKLFLLLLA